MKRRVFRFDILDGSEPPKPGDIMYPGWPTGRAWYRVVDVRPIDSPQWHDRWRLELERVDPETTRRGVGVELGARLIAWEPYERGETPQERVAASA